MCCSQQGHPDIVRFIVDNDPRCVFFCNAAGDTALHYAGHAPQLTHVFNTHTPTGISPSGLPRCDMRMYRMGNCRAGVAVARVLILAGADISRKNCVRTACFLPAALLCLLLSLPRMLAFD
jgi:hypothetical protein